MCVVCNVVSYSVVGECVLCVCVNMLWLGVKYVYISECVSCVLMQQKHVVWIIYSVVICVCNMCKLYNEYVVC